MKKTETERKVWLTADRKRAIVFSLGISAMLSSILLLAEIFSDMLHEEQK